jgi:hypothetical protein
MIPIHVGRQGGGGGPSCLGPLAKFSPEPVFLVFFVDNMWTSFWKYLYVSETVFRHNFATI